MPPELTQYLAWMVDRVQLPYDVGKGAICVSFASLEQNMHAVAYAWSNTFPLDNEKKRPVKNLMQEWKKSQENQQG